MGPLSGNNDIHAVDERTEDLELTGLVTTIALDDPVFMRPSAFPVPNVFSPGAPPAGPPVRAARPGSGESFEKPRQHRSDPPRQCQEFFALGHWHQRQGSEKLGRCCDFSAFTAGLGVPLPL